MTRYDDLMNDTVPKRKTMMMRVVDSQDYHLCWIEVEIEDEEPSRTEGSIQETLQ